MKLLLFILFLTEFVNPIVDDITDEIVEEIISDEPEQSDVSGDDVGTFYIIEDGHAVPVPEQIIVNDNSDLAVRLDSLIDLQKENTEALNDRISSLEYNVSSILGASVFSDSFDLPSYAENITSSISLSNGIYNSSSNSLINNTSGRFFILPYDPSYFYVFDFSCSSKSLLRFYSIDTPFYNYGTPLGSLSAVSLSTDSFVFLDSSVSVWGSSSYVIVQFPITITLNNAYRISVSPPDDPDNPDNPDNPDIPDNPDDPIIPDEPDSTILDGINKTNAYLKAIEKSNRDLKRLLEIVGFCSIVSSIFPLLRSAIHKLMFREDN